MKRHSSIVRHPGRYVQARSAIPSSTLSSQGGARGKLCLLSEGAKAEKMRIKIEKLREAKAEARKRVQFVGRRRRISSAGLQTSDDPVKSVVSSVAPGWWGTGHQIHRQIDPKYAFSRKVRRKEENFTISGNWRDIRKLVGSVEENAATCLLYTSPSPRDGLLSRMPSSA